MTARDAGRSGLDSLMRGLGARLWVKSLLHDGKLHIVFALKIRELSLIIHPKLRFCMGSVKCELLEQVQCGSV